MFGGNLEFPKHAKRSRPKPMKYDIHMPHLTPGVYAHMGREPNTDYHVRLLQYKQRTTSEHNKFLAAEAKRLLSDTIDAKYDKHFDKKTFQRLIEERFKAKMAVYEQSIEVRREKLKELLCKEEIEYIQETILCAQKGVETKMQEMKKRAELLKAQREAERLEIVKKKRIQQQMNDYVELRPYLIKRNLDDSKSCQLQQMLENEARREAEKEIEQMWHEMMEKEVQSKIEREEHEFLSRNKTQKEMEEVWQKQIEGKELLKKESDRIAAEDRIEMVKLQEQIRREEIEALDSKRRKRDQRAKELFAQIRQQEEIMEQRRREEKALDDAFSQLADLEVRKELEKKQNTTEVAKRESAIYRKYLKELEEERKKEEHQLHELLEQHKREIEKKQDEARCKIKWAKEALQRDVLRGRAEQLEYKRQQAENQLKLKEAENELTRMAWETNERLQAEYERLEAEGIRQYRDDLKRQIEENVEKRRQEQEQLKRELEEGIEEERQYRQLLDKLVAIREDGVEPQHPFRRVIMNDYRCPCPRK